MTTLRSSQWVVFDETPQRPPRSWTTGLILVRVLLFVSGAALMVKTLGLAATLAVGLVFWALFWPN
jgi:hypothetical protein